jgi:hypothetical protein
MRSAKQPANAKRNHRGGVGLFFNELANTIADLALQSRRCARKHKIYTDAKCLNRGTVRALPMPEACEAHGGAEFWAAIALSFQPL